MMDRRRFLLTSLAGAVTAPFVAAAQGVRTAAYRISFLALTFKVPEVEIEEVASIFRAYGLPETTVASVAKAIGSDRRVSFLATQPCVLPRQSAGIPCGRLDCRKFLILPAPVSAP
jgi:hypothetical protein